MSTTNTIPTTSNPAAAALQAQLDQISAEIQSISTGIAQRQEALNKFPVEIEQHKGALAYATQIADRLKKQLADLAAAAS